MSEKFREDEQFHSILVLTWTNLVEYLFIYRMQEYSKNSKEQISHRSNGWMTIYFVVNKLKRI